MTEYETIIVEKKGAVGWIRLNRPDAMNAVTAQSQRDLRDAWFDMEEDRTIRVVVLTGTGKAFCAGADLKAGAGEPDEHGNPPPEFIDVADRTDRVMASFPKPIIAALNGITVGGGLELAMMADLIVATESAKIGDGHLRFGMLPGGGASLRLPRLIGLMNARKLIFSGELWSAARMLDLGLLAYVYPDTTFEDDVTALAEDLARKSPLAVRALKRLINGGFDTTDDLAVRAEKDAVRVHMKTRDAQEGMAAFAERRAPIYKGY